MSTPVNPLVGQPNLAQQAAQYTPPNAPVPAAMQAPINMPNTGAPPTFPAQPQPQVVKGPSPWQRVVHALLGSQTEYQQTPNGPVPIQVQNKPGQLFRSILAGAILGAGAGTANAEHNAGSGWGAAGAAAKAVSQNYQQQQQLKQQQAQQQFENQQKLKEEDREQQRLNQQKLFNDAQIANWHTQAAVEQHNSDRADQEYLDRKNAANKTLFDNLQQAGAKAPTDIPSVMSAYDLSNEYVKTQGKVAQSPLGFHRIFIDTTSGDNVEFNGSDPAHPRWVDTDTGKDVDMTGKTEFKVLDVPNNTMNQRTPIKNSDVFKLLGETVPGMDPNGTQMLSPADMLTLAAKNREIGLEKQRISNETRQMNIARFNAANETAQRDIDAINKQIQEEKNQLNPDQNKLNELNDSLKATKDWIDKQYYDIWGVKAPKTITPPPSTAPPASASGAQGLVDQMTQDAKIQPGTYQAYDFIQNSSLTPDQKGVALKISNTPVPWMKATELADRYMQKTPMSRKEAMQKVVNELKAKGISVADRPDDVYSPYPPVSTSNPEGIIPSR